jgi:hypothetical protein
VSDYRTDDDVMSEIVAENTRLRDRVKALETDLAWYGEQARLARLIHSGGDAGRQALAEDGGKRARATLETTP